MQGLPPLGRNITKHTVKDFAVWSNKYKLESVPLTQLIDKDAKFTINNYVWSQRKELGLSDDEARHWYTEWTHVQLSEYMSKIWPNNTNNNLHVDVVTANDKFVINLDCKD